MLGSIRHQLTLIISLLIVFALATVLVSSYYLVAADYEKKMQHNNFVLAESLADNIAQFLQNAYNINQFTAAYPDLATSDAEKHQRLLVDTVARYPFFQLLITHDLNGNQIARTSGQLTNRADRWWFKKFMAERTPYITKTYYSLASESPITTILHGIYQQGNLVGLLMSDIETRRLQQMVEGYNSGAGSYAYLLDGEGVVIAHPDRQQVAELYNYKTMKKTVLSRDDNGIILKDDKKNEITDEIDFSVAPSLQVIVNKVMAGETGMGEYTDLDGAENICAYHTILLPGTSDSWSLIVVQKKSVALAFVRDVAIKNIVAGIAVLLLSIALAVWFSRLITRPLLKIVNATSQIKEGDLTARLDIASFNEVGVLATNFNQMVAELAQHRERLEDLVTARTRELGAANEELTAMNEEMTAINEVLEGSNERLAAEITVRQQTENNLLLREQQYRAATHLLTRPSDEMEGLLESILRDAIQLVKAPDGYIGLYDDNGRFFYIHHAVGIHEPRIMQPEPVELGMQGYVYQSGEMFYVEDYSKYPNRMKEKCLDRLSSMLMFPLKQAGEVKGILAASWVDTVHPVSKEDVEVLKQFADLAAVAMERATTQKLIRQIAFHDTLTGLPNRANVHMYLEEEMKLARRGESSGSILFIDIDELKNINDNFGHSYGDSVIIAAGKHIVEALGEKAFAARIGGDEFIVVLPGENNREKAGQIADKTIRALCQEYEVSVERIHMSASMGVVVYPDDGDRVEDILKKADSALYAAKRAGRNCWRFYEPILLEEAYEKMMLTNGLRRALEREELFLHYQPQWTLAGEAVVGFEALLRWNSPEYGLVSPVQFIPLAEQSGLILPIGQWVLQEACRFARQLADKGKAHVHVAVNISSRQLLADDFVTMVCTSIAAAGIEPKQLEIEITESVLIESLEESVRKLSQLRELGVKLSLDDFGTGYSSLTYLRSLPVDILKIDKSFIDKIACDETQLQVAGTIITLGHSLGLLIVAEGVETPDQLTLLAQFGCDRVQGYIFSRPIAAEAAFQLLG